MLDLPCILHPTDFSTSSHYAFRLACALARDHGSRLIVLHAVLTLGPELISEGEAVSQLQPEAYQAKLWAELRQVEAPDPSIQLKHQLVEGDAATEIVRVATQEHANLIVMGTHGRSGLERFMLGSVAEQVIRYADCPVLTVKAPPSASAK